MPAGSSDRVRLLLVSFVIAVYVIASYAVYALREDVIWMRVLIEVAQTAAFLLAFSELLKARGMSPGIVRAVLVAGGLLFSSLLLLHKSLDFVPLSWWYVSMPQWGGWLIALGLLGGLPAGALSPRAAVQRGWQSEWFAWTSSLLAAAALYALTREVHVWAVREAPSYGLSAMSHATVRYAGVMALAGLSYGAATLLYVRLMPRLLPRRPLLWGLLLVAGAVLVALPLIANEPSLPDGLQRLGLRLLAHWPTAPVAGNAILFASILGLWPKRAAAGATAAAD